MNYSSIIACSCGVVPAVVPALVRNSPMVCTEFPNFRCDVRTEFPNGMVQANLKFQAHYIIIRVYLFQFNSIQICAATNAAGLTKRQRICTNRKSMIHNLDIKCHNTFTFFSDIVLRTYISTTFFFLINLFAFLFMFGQFFLSQF